LYKTELIKPRGPCRSLADVELATAEYIGWYNNKRLHTAIGGIPPAEHEACLLRSKPASTDGWTQQLKPPRNPGRFRTRP
jgi:transposase InsO family protein